MSKILLFINSFFIVYLVVYSFIFFISTMYALIIMDERRKNRELIHYMPEHIEIDELPITIVVPAYNEEKTIIACIESLLNLDYPLYEIVIVNDGSVDRTSECIIEQFNLDLISRPIRKQLETEAIQAVYEGSAGVSITLVDKVNGGKADAINAGINVSNYPLFICLDADSILKEDSLREITMPFKMNEQVVAVGGNIKVANDKVIQKGHIVGTKSIKNLWVRWQMVEYPRVFMGTRVWLNAFNANLIVSGAFGVFRKQQVIDVGGYTRNCIGEDMELIMKLHSYHRKNKLPYKIEYVPRAICWTQVPNRLKDIRNQRKRWHYGLMESLFKHRYMFMDTQYGAIGTFAYLYYGIFELSSCIIEAIGLINIVILLALQVLRLETFLYLLLFYVLYNYLIACAAYLIDSDMTEQKVVLKDFVVWLGISLIESFLIKPLFMVYRLGAVYNYMRSKQEWNKAVRQEV